MKCKVKARYTFEVEWEVEATDKDDARRIVDNDCGCVLGSIHSSDSRVDWTGSTHATKIEIFKPKVVEEDEE